MLNDTGSGPPATVNLGALVAGLLEHSPISQREIAARAGLSKDQLSRTIAGKRPVELDEALSILKAVELPARGAITLALFQRPDLAVEWSESGLSSFLETLIEALPEALVAEIGDDLDRINPRWGHLAARFVAQRIKHHIQEIIEREETLGNFEPRPRVVASR